MPEKRHSSGTKQLSTTVQRGIHIIPPAALWMIRIIAGAVAAIALVVQVQTHVLGTHQEEAHGLLEFAAEVAPFAFAIILSVVIIAMPQAFAVAVLEIISRLGRKLGDLIPNRGSKNGS